MDETKDETTRVPGWVAQTLARGGEIPSNGMEQKRARPTRCWSLVLADLLVVSVVSMVALARRHRGAALSGAIDSGDAA
jgi:hypothetical protein